MISRRMFWSSIAMLMIGCGPFPDGTFRDQEGNILYATEADIEEAQRKVLTPEIPANLPESADGFVLFDGRVVSVDTNPSGLYITLFDVEKVLFGDLEGEKLVAIHSPSPEKTGIDFKEGEVYRVLSWYIGEAYRTWDWMGTVRLDSEESPPE